MEDQFPVSAINALEADVRQRSPLGPIYGEAIAVAIATHLVHSYAEVACERIEKPFQPAKV